MKSKLNLIFLGLLLIAGFSLRLKDISSPLADWHSWRQADTASVAREYVKNGINLLVPKYHDISSLQSGKENLEGYRMVEFPAVNALVAYIYQTVPGVKSFEIHVVYRFINILFSLISAIFLYLIISNLESKFTGLLTAGIFLILPYNVFYSRTVLPEVGMVAASLAGLYFGIKFSQSYRIWHLLIAIIFMSLALLIKPVAIFLLFPLLPLALAGKPNLKQLTLWLGLAIFSLLPLFWWRFHIATYSEGIPASAWLLNGNGIRFKGAFFYWLFADRIGRIILGYWGLIFLGVGLLAKKKSNLIFWWLISALVYLSVFATGNVQHDYYQIPIIPIISIYIAYGIQFLRRLSGSVLPRYGLILTAGIFMIAFSWYHVRTLYSINNPAIVAAGIAVDALTPKEALIIAPYQGDTAFLYQTNRLGWPIGGDIDSKIDKGADYYVTVTEDDEAKKLEASYPVVSKTAEYILIKLNP